MWTVEHDLKQHHRRSIRLEGYDYGQPGAYFITVCTQDRDCLFGDVVDGDMRLNDAGRLVQATWRGLPEHYSGVGLDAFVVMPNHVHGVVVFGDVVEAAAGGHGGATDGGGHGGGAGLKTAPARRHGLGEIVRGFKTFSARRINALRGTTGMRLWQRNYYEHVIRDAVSLSRIRQYILDNPTQWAFDRENPAGRTPRPG